MTELDKTVSALSGAISAMRWAMTDCRQAAKTGDEAARTGVGLLSQSIKECEHVLRRTVKELESGE